MVAVAALCAIAGTLSIPVLVWWGRRADEELSRRPPTAPVAPPAPGETRALYVHEVRATLGDEAAEGARWAIDAERRSATWGFGAVMAGLFALVGWPMFAIEGSPPPAAVVGLCALTAAIFPCLARARRWNAEYGRRTRAVLGEHAQTIRLRDYSPPGG